jgi:hypothetical protein
MAKAKCLWWIEERGVWGIHRLRYYDPYPDRLAAEQKIKQLNFIARYRKADLVASEEVISSSKPPQNHS